MNSETNNTSLNILQLSRALDNDEINAQQKAIFIEERRKRMAEDRTQQAKAKEEQEKREKENATLLNRKYYKRLVPKKENDKIDSGIEFEDIRELIIEELRKDGNTPKSYIEFVKVLKSSSDKDKLSRMLTKMTTEKKLKYSNYSQQYIIRSLA